MSEKFSSEQLNKDLREAELGLKENLDKKEALDKSNPASRLIAAITLKRRGIEKSVEQSKTTYEENLRIAEQHMDEMHEEAKEYVRTYEIYQGERERLIQELGSQYIARVEKVPWPGSSSDINSYVAELQQLKVEEGATLDDRARIMAAIDILKPKMANPGYAGSTFVIGEGHDRREVGIRNGTRFPRWEIGKDDIGSASEIAKSKKWKHVLEVSTTVAYPPEKESNKPPYIVAEKNIYIAVSEDTAKLLDQAGVDNLNSSSSLGEAWGRQQGRYRGTMNESFRVVDLDD